MLTKHILILIFIVYTYQSSGFLYDAYLCVKNIWKITGFFKDFDDRIDVSKKIVGILTGAESDNQEVLDELSALSQQTREMDQKIMEQFDIVKDLIRQLPKEIAAEHHDLMLHHYFDRINELYDQLLQHIELRVDYSAWQKFAEKVTQMIPDKIDGLRELLAPGSEPRPRSGLLMDIAERGDLASDDLCHETQTFQYLLLHLLEKLMLLEMKTITMLSLNAFFPSANSNSSKDTIDIARADFERRFHYYLTATFNAMEKAPGILRVCDPPKNRDGMEDDRKYIELEGLVHTSLHLIADPNDSCLTGRLPDPKGTIWDPYWDNCGGDYGSCLYSDWMFLCRWTDGGKFQRYWWIEMEGYSLGRYHNEDKCPNGFTRKSQSLNPFLYYISKLFTRPGHCLCTCYTHKENSIYLGLVLSNVTGNKVITGVRFERWNKILYIRIREGELLPNGRIDNSSQRWVPLPSDSQTTYLNVSYRNFVLSDVLVPFGYALVGVQFVDHPNITKYGVEGGVSLRAIGQKFDYRTGILLPGSIEIFTRRDHTYENLPFARLNSLYGKNLTHKPQSLSNKYRVELDRSSWESDIGGYVLPLFEGISVVTDPPSPLGGIGMFHNAVEDYAGFISLRLHSLPYKRYLKEILRNYKPGRALDECNQPSCSFDEILDLAEGVYRLMRKIVETDEEKYDDEVLAMTKIFKKNGPISEITMAFNDIKLKLSRPNYYMKIHDLRALFNEAIGPFVSDSVKIAIEPSVFDNIKNIDSAFNNLVDYSEGIYGDFTRFWASGNYRISNRTNVLHQILLEKWKTAKNQCMDRSTHHILVQMFRTVVVTEVKAMVVLAFSYRIYKRKLSTPWEEEFLAERDNFKKRFMSYVEEFADVMKRAPNAIRACDKFVYPKTIDRRIYVEEPPKPGPPTKISLEFMQTIIDDNMVVAGLRFVVQEGILHIQVKQGKLLPYGKIDAPSRRWLFRPYNPETIDLNVNNRKLFLGDVTFLPEYAIIGLQFSQRDGGFFINVTARKFDFSTGKLLSQEFRLSNDNKRHKGMNSMMPYKIDGYLPHDSENNEKWVQLSIPDSPEDKGSVRTTFDENDVDGHPPTPLGGIGAFYERNDTAGTVFLRLLPPRYDINLRDFIKKDKRQDAFVDF